MHHPPDAGEQLTIGITARRLRDFVTCLVYDLRLSDAGRAPVVVRDSTLATLYAFFSSVAANSCAGASLMSMPRVKASDIMFSARRRTVSARCSSERDQSWSAMLQSGIANGAAGRL